MTDIISWDDFDEIQAKMAAAEEAANGRLTQAQKSLRDATDRDMYWVQFTRHGFAVFGHCWSEKTLREKTAESYAKYGEEAEYMEEEIASSIDQRRRGYMFGEAWSGPYPQGELGSTHVSQVVPISLEMFERAREAGWKTP